jgi:hypothetical protein
VVLADRQRRDQFAKTRSMVFLVLLLLAGQAISA